MDAVILLHLLQVMDAYSGWSPIMSVYRQFRNGDSSSDIVVFSPFYGTSLLPCRDAKMEGREPQGGYREDGL